MALELHRPGTHLRAYVSYYVGATASASLLIVFLTWRVAGLLTRKATSEARRVGPGDPTGVLVQLPGRRVVSGDLI